MTFKSILCLSLLVLLLASPLARAGDPAPDEDGKITGDVDHSEVADPSRAAGVVSKVEAVEDATARGAVKILKATPGAIKGTANAIKDAAVWTAEATRYVAQKAKAWHDGLAETYNRLEKKKLEAEFPREGPLGHKQFKEYCGGFSGYGPIRLMDKSLKDADAALKSASKTYTAFHKACETGGFLNKAGSYKEALRDYNDWRTAALPIRDWAPKMVQELDKLDANIAPNAPRCALAITELFRAEEYLHHTMSDDLHCVPPPNKVPDTMWEKFALWYKHGTFPADFQGSVVGAIYGRRPGPVEPKFDFKPKKGGWKNDNLIPDAGPDPKGSQPLEDMPLEFPMQK